MEDFKHYFEKRGYKPRTIRGYTNSLKQFFRWCEDNCINPEVATIEELYDYQSYTREQGLAVATIRERTIILKHYYRCIKRPENPALLLRAERQEKKLPKGMLDEEMLVELYLGILPKTHIQKRNKCMLGLILFQGLKRADLSQLKPEHINEDQSRIYVPETNKTNARYIPLKAIQREDLRHYIYTLRSQLIIEARKESDYLFFSQGTGKGLNNSLGLMFRALKKQYPNLGSLQQLRESKITLWVKEFGIRKTQYLSGIRYASSVLRYKAIDNDKLKHKIALIHPMERM